MGINLYEIEGNLFSCSETCHIHNIDPHTLDTKNKKVLSSKLNLKSNLIQSTQANPSRHCPLQIDLYKYFGIYLATAHPLKCKKTGDLFNIGTSFKPTVKYQVMRIPNLNSSNAKDGKIQILIQMILKLFIQSMIMKGMG